MISRYTREEMGRVWTEEGKFRRWLEVELAATETLAETGVVPAAAAAKIREKARVDGGVVKRIAELEAKVKHDVIAFTMAVGETIGDPDAARWLHYGLTSNDVVDTAQALQIREASRLIEHGLVRFGEVLERRAREFQHTPQIGRTHGIHAEPITFGLKVANWFAENRRNLERFGQAARQMAVGKISGAVGNASHLGPDVEAAICKRLGLDVAPVASQVIQRDRHAQYLCGAGDPHGHARKNRPGNPPLAAHRSARGRGAVRRRAARKFGHAAQAQSGVERTGVRPGARRPRQRRRGV